MTGEATPGERAGWHLDKRVPIALIVTIAIQTLAGGFWLGSLANRVATLESAGAQSVGFPVRLAVAETQIAEVRAQITDIKAILLRIDDRLARQSRQP